MPEVLPAVLSEALQDSVREAVRKCLHLPSDVQLHRALEVVILPELVAHVLDYAYEGTFLLARRHLMRPGDTFLDMGELRTVLAVILQEPAYQSKGWSKANKELWAAVLSYLRRNVEGLVDVDRWPLYMRWKAENLIATRKGCYSPSDWYFELRIQDIELRHACCDNCRQTTIPDVKDLIDDAALLVGVLTHIVEGQSRSWGFGAVDRRMPAFYQPGVSIGQKFEQGRALCQFAVPRMAALSTTFVVLLTAVSPWSKILIHV